MSNREYIKSQIDVLPDSVIDKIQEFIAFQKFSLSMFEDDTEYLSSIPGMVELIKKGMDTPISDCLESVGWDIS